MTTHPLPPSLSPCGASTRATTRVHPPNNQIPATTCMTPSTEYTSFFECVCVCVCVCGETGSKGGANRNKAAKTDRHLGSCIPREEKSSTSTRVAKGVRGVRGKVTCGDNAHGYMKERRGEEDKKGGGCKKNQTHQSSPVTHLDLFSRCARASTHDGSRYGRVRLRL
ncbi:hypothetical protein EJ05DRAFT_196563 [Pseudovirgaria hyperparasitica]|uniref:Uncharacterized protein n=1 Tax=Pseudovirgaria hyperparasitica TaxID=470096 RepID=A0A6A6WIJ0_9PEZI|nr:uncharacterized protein EJ05DRAFT_196563 [Pseudovirgaria hyperparasitica]KAF2762089.1 hypothetical protein EJ05DRAFT_196563 [Pseudovirgaria hyperparasitica]